jgi:hypothetical protein
VAKVLLPVATAAAAAVAVLVVVLPDLAMLLLATTIATKRDAADQELAGVHCMRGWVQQKQQSRLLRQLRWAGG